MSRLAAAHRPSRALAAIAAAVLAAVLGALLIPASAGAKFRIGFQDDDYVTADAGLREKLFDKTVKQNASVVRLNVRWASVAVRRPANPSDPADPAYDFGALDAAVREATTRGLTPLIMFDYAPGWAEGPGRADTLPAGTWIPSPSAVADFARALATRYSGGFADLPRVRYYQVWNEPNIFQFLNPQRGDRGKSPGIYRRMLNAAYGAIKGVHRRNRVVTAGPAPYGDDSGPFRTRPLAFLRAMLCLQPNLKGTTCDERTHFDILADHPINTNGGPTEGAQHRDDVAGSDFKRVRKVLRAAERIGTAPGGRHPLWATEVWWVTNPPNPFNDWRVSLETQARYIQQAFYVLWRQGADVVLNFQVHDAPYDSAHPYANVQTGVFFNDFRPKPSATAFAFPFVTDRRSKGRVLAWGIAPKKGKLRIQRRAKKRWRTIDRVRVKRGKVFKTKVRVRGKAKLRAKVKGRKSLVWKQGR